MATTEKEVRETTPPSPPPAAKKKKANGKATGGGHQWSPAARARLSDAMKAAHAKKPSWRMRGDNMEKRDAKIRQLLKIPNLSARQIAERLKIHVGRVYRVISLDGGPVRDGAAVVNPKHVEARKALAAGASKSEVVAKFHISWETAKKLADGIGGMAKKPAPGKGLTLAAPAPSAMKQEIQARHAKIIAFLNQGLHPREIANRMGLNVGTIYYVKVKAEGGEWGSKERKRQARAQARAPVVIEAGDNHMHEVINWLKHASQEAYKSIRAGREPTVAELYAILAYRTAAQTR